MANVVRPTAPADGILRNADEVLRQVVGDDGSGGYLLKSSATITTGDIEIGAVELKDGVTDARGTVTSANAARAASTTVLATQDIDEAGNVLGRTAANTARTTATKVNPVQVVDAAGNVFNLTAANTARTTATLVLPTTPVDATGDIIGDAFSGGGDIQVQITTAGTAVTLGSTTACKEITIVARSTNAANIKVGLTSSPKAQITPGGSVTIPINDIAKVYVDGTNNDYVEGFYFT